ncbi:hypothetical protein ANO11243_085580 [Dothideomycetidae sp. 11243]|nr:hypothetical protein ANO11243_085580 [fungal sp. No.11243]
MPSIQLPIDVLHIIAYELAEQQDFSTLYRCAISGSAFAKSGAIQHLYSEATSTEVPYGEQESVVQRWSILWRSIILSSLGKTLFPYCNFLRVLDLRDLLFLLDDDKFRGRISGYFFSGDLAYLNMTVELPKVRSAPRKPRLDTKNIILSIADSITKQAIKLEVLTEPVAPGLDLLSAGLSQWSPRLRNLEFLQIGDGIVLGDEAVQDLLIQSCPHLNKLEIYLWKNDDRSDAALGRFFRRLPPNTLISFQNESDCGIGQETCAALSTHAQSLESLNLAVGHKGIAGLGALKPCTNLSFLKLSDFNAPHRLEETENDVLADMIDWLNACTKLKSLVLTNFLSTPRLLAPAFESGRLQLDYLEISGSLRQGGLYALSGNETFHRALSKQTSLKTLLLAADAEGSSQDDHRVLCDAVIALRSLKKLDMSRSSEQFDDTHLLAICGALFDLEELSIDAYLATDVSLIDMHKLSQLKSVTFAGYSTFSFAALNSFIDKLGSGNTGLTMDVQNPVFESSLSEREQANIKRNLKRHVDGTFLYQVRGAQISIFMNRHSLTQSQIPPKHIKAPTAIRIDARDDREISYKKYRDLGERQHDLRYQIRMRMEQNPIKCPTIQKLPN